MPSDREKNSNKKTKPRKVSNNKKEITGRKKRTQQASLEKNNQKRVQQSSKVGKKHNKSQQTGNMESNKRPKAKKSKKNKFSNRHPKLMMTIKIMIVLFLLLCVIGAGIIVGVFFGLFGDDFEIKQEQLKIGAANSVVVTSDGSQEIANLQRR